MMSLSKEDTQAVSQTGLEIAVIGMAGRFPGAKTLTEFWDNLTQGVESVTFFSDEELLEAGIAPEALRNPNYVKAKPFLEGIEAFDAPFFEYSPKEVEQMDPQFRVFHECVWEALEQAGYNPWSYKGRIGLYAGTSTNLRWIGRFLKGVSSPSEEVEKILLNFSYNLGARIAYKLNFRGPVVAVEAACSTSLAAIHLACQSLLSGECRIALAGGVSIALPKKHGYVYQEGMLHSPDGHCRAFDAHAKGTIFGDGAGVVVLKPLERALADGDTIHALITGSAMNNDGNRKVGYTAPSVSGQAGVIRMAQRVARVSAERISYVETQGSATEVGDSIEIAALTSAFQTDKRGFCAIGSLKSNVGHLNNAAGVAGFIKTVLALKHQQLPPSLHFNTPNPEIDFAHSPFYVNTTLTDWQNDGYPLRAGVNAFGIGGTNVHVVLEEAPQRPPSSERREPELLLLSARTPTALETMTANLTEFFRNHPSTNLSDVAYTLQVGRPAFSQRRVVVCSTVKEAIDHLSGAPYTTSLADANEKPVVFMFPGQGSQYVNMGRDLYEHEPVFREEMERCFALASPLMGKSLKTLLYPDDPSCADSAAINRTATVQLALFILEYALAKVLLKWGLTPRAMIGHGMGEYTAACLAGVFSLEDALGLVVARGQLAQTMPPGAILSVSLSEETGPPAMLEPVLAGFEARVRAISLNEPQMPYISNVTGTWITGEEATNPAYWAEHVRKTVRFAEGLGALLQEPRTVFVEVGPGRVLRTFARQHRASRPEHVMVNLLRHPQEAGSDVAYFLERLGRVWCAGATLDWEAVHAGEQRRRAPLPTYPFERQRYWPASQGQRRVSQGASDTQPDSSDPSFRERASAETNPSGSRYARPTLPNAYVPPRNRTERLLADMWQEVLGIAEIGMSDNFYELGGSSLLAMQLVSRIRDTFAIELPIRRFFETLTIADVTRAILEDQQGKAGDEYEVTRLGSHDGALADSRPLAPIVRQPRTTQTFPLSFAQERLWFLDQLEPGNSPYNIFTAMRLTGQLDVAVLERSFNDIVRRHEILRTTFATMNGCPVQSIAPALSISLPVVDLLTLPKPEREAEVRRLVTEEAQSPFDLAHGPLLRIRVLRVKENEHVLLLTIHHIVSDGWSLGIFIQEVTALYQAVAAEKRSALPELLFQYADFAVWQREWLQGDVLQAQLAYWKQQLDGDLPVLEFPADFPRPPIQTFRGERESLTLPRRLTERLKLLSRQQGCTLFMTMLAAFKILLYRYTGQEDIVVGTPIANRNRSELERLIGFFVNTLVLRTDLSGSPPFHELLNRIREMTLGAYAHQDMPFEMLVEALQPERDLSRTPLFQVFFNMLNLPNSEIEFPGVKIEALSSPEVASMFDLTLYVSDQGEEIQLEAVYNADLFARARMTEMLEQFKLLLSQIGARPEARITSFSLVTSKTEALLPNPTQALASRWEGAIQMRFSRQAQRVPAQLAVVDPREAWTYTELNARSNQLAHYLLDSGIQSRDIVAIYAHRSSSLVWALLGVLKAGAAFVILDPAYPVARLIECLRMAKPRGWLQLEAAGSLPEALEEFVRARSWGCTLELPQRTMAATRDFLRDYSPDAPKVATGPDDLAYVAFTSGSTGNPKGIVGPHRPLPHFLRWHSQTFGLTESDRFSMLSGLSHDPLLRDIFTPLWVGATLYIPDPEDIFSPSLLVEWLRQKKISVAHLTPPLGRLLTQAPLDIRSADRGEAPLASLRYVFFGGDVVTQHDVLAMQKVAPSATCVNFYGTTETPQGMGYFIVPQRGDVPPPLERRGRWGPEHIPLGRGIQDVQLLILTASRRLAGIGEIGAICVRTPYLTRGYLGDERLTEKRFMTNPYTGATADRLYRTGDWGRYLPDGNVEFLGRDDHQVKIRGFRIEREEVEMVLRDHPAVREAIVLVREETSGEKRLVAYVVLHQGHTPTVSDLCEYLRATLPLYMAPTAYVMLDTLPLTPNGKVDHKALPEPEEGRPELKAMYVPPKTKVERIIANIWQEVLQIEKVGIHDNFFELGGHSLLAMQFYNMLKEKLDIDLPFRHFYDLPTIQGVCQFLANREDREREEHLDDVNNALRTTFGNVCVLIKYHVTDFTQDFMVLFAANEKQEEIIRYLQSHYSPKMTPHYIRDYPPKIQALQNYIHPLNTISFYQEIGAKSISSDSQSEMETITTRVLHVHTVLESTLKSTRVVEQYEYGYHQKRCIENNFRSGLWVMFDIDDEPHVEPVVNALMQLINRHAILRTVLRKQPSTYYFVEYEEVHDLQFPIIDLSTLNFDAIKIVGKNIVLPLLQELKNTDLYKNPELCNEILFRTVILKLNYKQFTVIFCTDHLIIDREGGELLKKSFFQCLHDTIERKPDNRLQYKDYIKLTNCLTTKDTTTKFKERKQYLEFKTAVLNLRQKNPALVKNNALFSDPYSLEYSLNENEMQEPYDMSLTLGVGLHVALNICGIMFNTETIPIVMVANRRVIAKHDFSNVVGDMHDHIPLLFNIASDTPHSITEKIIMTDKDLSDSGLYFIGMKFVDREIDDIIFHSPLVFNYLGEREAGSFSMVKQDVVRPSSIDAYMIRMVILGTHKIVLSFVNGIHEKKLSRIKRYLDVNAQTYKLRHHQD